MEGERKVEVRLSTECCDAGVMVRPGKSMEEATWRCERCGADKPVTHADRVVQGPLPTKCIESQPSPDQ